MMRRTVVNPKGQVRIPFALRKRLEITGVNRGEEPGRSVMAPMTLRHRNQSGGFFTRKPGQLSAI
jgi:hypothetical protein